MEKPVSQTYPKLVLELLYGMDQLSGDGADSDQVLHFMAWIGEAIGDLDESERLTLVSTARELADEAETSGDLVRADALRRFADAEDPS